MFGFLRRRGPVKLEGELDLAPREREHVVRIQEGWRPADALSAALLAEILEGPLPQILGTLRYGDEARLRLSASLSQLGVRGAARASLSKHFATARGHDREAATRCLLAAAYHRTRLKRFREAGVRLVRILAVKDGHTCVNCERIGGTVLRIDSAPDIPLADCTCTGGCRCSIQAVLNEY